MNGANIDIMLKGYQYQSPFLITSAKFIIFLACAINDIVQQLLRIASVAVTFNVSLLLKIENLSTIHVHKTINILIILQ